MRFVFCSMGAGFSIDGIYASGIKSTAITRTEPYRDIVFMFGFGEPERRHTAISDSKSATTSAQSH